MNFKYFKNQILKLIYYVVVIIILINLFNIINYAKNDDLLKRNGRKIINAKSEEVYLKGFNLGGWLNWEGWMWNNWNNPAEHVIIDTLKKYIDETETINFWKKIHDIFISEKDFTAIKSFGFNCIRLPVNYKLLYDDENGNKFSNYGFTILDRIINLCRENNIYVIIDLHSVPGGPIF